jgi:hypothetical protein
VRAPTFEAEKMSEDGFHAFVLASLNRSEFGQESPMANHCRKTPTIGAQFSVRHHSRSVVSALATRDAVIG